MSHEIRTPMNAIIGLNNIALNEPDVPERVAGHLRKMGASAQHLLSIINDILLECKTKPVAEISRKRYKRKFARSRPLYEVCS